MILPRGSAEQAPFVLALELLELKRALTKDIASLNCFNMTHVTTSYKLKYGLV